MVFGPCRVMTSGMGGESSGEEWGIVTRKFLKKENRVKYLIKNVCWSKVD